MEQRWNIRWRASPPEHRRADVVGAAGEALLAAAPPERADIKQVMPGMTGFLRHKSFLLAVAQGHQLEVRRYRGLGLPDR
jgi:hypothetical protein